VGRVCRLLLPVVGWQQLGKNRKRKKTRPFPALASSHSGKKKNYHRRSSPIHPAKGDRQQQPQQQQQQQQQHPRVHRPPPSPASFDRRSHTPRKRTVVVIFCEKGDIHPRLLPLREGSRVAIRGPLAQSVPSFLLLSFFA
jgi:hypothetical protein